MQVSEYQGSSWYTQSLLSAVPNAGKTQDFSDTFPIEGIGKIEDGGDASDSLVSKKENPQTGDFAYLLYLQEMQQRETIPLVENPSDEAQSDLMEATDSQMTPQDEVSAPKSSKGESDDKETTSEIVVNPDGSKQLIITTKMGGTEVVTKLELSPEQQDDSFAPFQQQDTGNEAVEDFKAERPNIRPSFLMNALSAYEASFQYSL